jgi:hypothetical protein
MGDTAALPPQDRGIPYFSKDCQKSVRRFAAVFFVQPPLTAALTTALFYINGLECGGCIQPAKKCGGCSEPPQSFSRNMNITFCFTISNFSPLRFGLRFEFSSYQRRA